MSNELTYKSILKSCIELFFKSLVTITICSTVIVLFFMLLVRTQHQDSFGHQKSRLARQLQIVMTEKVSQSSGATLSDDQRFALCRELIKNYDPKTDSLDLSSNPNKNNEYNLMKILEKVTFSKDGKIVTLKEQFSDEADKLTGDFEKKEF